MRSKLILLLLVLLLNKISNATDYYWVGGTGMWSDYTDCEVANAGADQTTCGASSITLAANAIPGGNWTGGAGTFAPNRNAAFATYTPAISEIGTTITLTWNVPDPDGTGPCTSTADQMNINSATVANAGADQTTCGASSITLAANANAGANWTGGAGTFSPNRSAANATYTPAASEIGATITLTWNVPDPDGAGPCTAATDQMNITINNATVANAGADQTSCGTTFVILAANTMSGGNWTGGLGIFSPDRNTANATYIPAPSEVGTTITLTWNVPDPDGAGPCTAATDQMNITINNATVANAGADQTTCGASSITLAANTTTGGNWTGGAGTFNPSRNTANTTYTPAVGEIGTIITLTWNVPDPDGAGPCTSASDAMTITVNAPVTANAGPDQTVCSVFPIPVYLNANNGGNWTGGTGTFLPDRNTANATYVPAPGEVGTTVTLTWNVADPDGAGPCTAAADQMNIVINTPIPPTFTQIGPLCQNSTAPALPGTSNNGINGTWSPATINTSTTGTTTYRFTPIAGQCAHPDTMNIVIELCCTGSVSVGTDATSYFGLISEQCVTKTAVVQNGTAPFTYLWTLDRSLLTGESMGGANSQIVTVCLLDTANLCVTVTDSNGCIFTDCAVIFAQDVRCFAGNSDDHKIKMCHNNSTICVDQSTVNTHLSHGDYIGQCNASTAVQTELVGEEIPRSWLKIYPNPGHGNFTLYLNSSRSDINYVDAEIINMSGQIIKQVKINGQSKIDFRINNAGVYFIRVISTNRKILTRKVVVME